MRRQIIGVSILGIVILALVLGPFRGAEQARGGAPAWFSDTAVISGLDHPTAVRFAPDGRVFVAEQGGKILEYDDLTDTSPTLVADLTPDVQFYWDRGMLGLAVDPGFPERPFLYASYSVDQRVGTTSAGTWGDTCPTPPGPTTDGCTVRGRIVRLTVGGFPLAVTATKTLIDGEWCAQYPSHVLDDLQFGGDGELYASAGEGASAFTFDIGQGGGSAGSPTRANPCGDPPGGIGTRLAAPTAEGGALRAQSLRRAAGEPRLLSGAIIRVDPSTGAGLPDNPRGASSDGNERRVVAYGLRNPYRFTFRPDDSHPTESTDDLWVADVGLDSWEEIDHVEKPTSSLPNFGWPCFEGVPRQPGFAALGLSLCESLYADGTAAPPFFAYAHNAPVAPGDTCLSGPDGDDVPFGDAAGSITGISFYASGTYPAAYDGGLFFADYARNCIWVVLRGSDGDLDPSSVQTFVTGADTPVDLERGPGGDLFYVSIGTGTVHRISAAAPSASVTTAGPTTGPLPLVVSYDGSGSTAPAGHALAYAWDLDGDGAYDDSTAVAPSVTYSIAGAFDVRLRVTDAVTGLVTVSTPTRVVPGGSAPSVEITAPVSSLAWHVGDAIAFAGFGVDGEDGPLPVSALHWEVVMRHCDASGAACHSHRIESFDGVASGSFSAPDHEFPAHLELHLSATDSSGLSASRTVVLDPATVGLQLATNVAGLRLSAGPLVRETPFTATAIVGSSFTLDAPAVQSLGGKTYTFVSWSDGGARAHTVVADEPADYTATYAAPSGGGGGAGAATGAPDASLTPPVDAGGPLTPPTAVPPVISGVGVSPRVPSTGKRFTLTASVTRGATVRSTVTVGGRAIAASLSFRAGRLRLTFVVPRRTRGKLVRIGLRATLDGRVTRRSFGYRVG